MNDEEIKYRVRHAAELHGVPASEVVAEVEDEELPDELPEDMDYDDDDEDVLAPRIWGRRFAWLTSLMVVGGLLGAIIVGVLKFINGPVEAQPKVLAEEQVAAVPSVTPPATNQLSGLNIFMTYPGNFDQVSQVKTDPGSLEQYNLGSKGNYHHMIAVEVRPMTSGSMTEDANYRVRQMHPNEYTQAVQVVGGEPVAVLSKADGTEATLFWAHGGKYLLTVSITSSDTKDDIKAWMDVVRSGLRWRT